MGKGRDFVGSKFFTSHVRRRTSMIRQLEIQKGRNVTDGAITVEVFWIFGINELYPE